MNSLLKISALSAAFLMGSAFAGGPEVPMNQTGLYVGLGGSYNSVNETTSLSATGAILDGQNSLNVNQNQLVFAPYGEVGYFGAVSDSVLFGFKSWYKYLNANVTQSAVVSNSGNSTNVTSSIQVPHEFSMMLTLGYMFANSFVYMGGGSILFDAQVTPPAADTESKVIWGGAAQVGWAYYLSPTWFLDFAYTYAISSNYDFTRTGTVTGDSGASKSYTFNADATQIRAQEFVASVSKVFAF